MEGRKRITFTVVEGYDYEDGYFDRGMTEVLEALKGYFREKNKSMSEDQLVSYTFNEVLFEGASNFLGREKTERIWEDACKARRIKELEVGSKDDSITSTHPMPE